MQPFQEITRIPACELAIYLAQDWRCVSYHYCFFGGNKIGAGYTLVR